MPSKLGSIFKYNVVNIIYIIQFYVVGDFMILPQNTVIWSWTPSFWPINISQNLNKTKLIFSFALQWLFTQSVSFFFFWVSLKLFCINFNINLKKLIQVWVSTGGYKKLWYCLYINTKFWSRSMLYFWHNR